MSNPNQINSKEKYKIALEKKKKDSDKHVARRGEVKSDKQNSSSRSSRKMFRRKSG
jgi:hypothetical protein